MWTDGSSVRRKDLEGFDGAWAFVALFGGRRLERYQGGYEKNGTISAMEMCAIFASLALLEPTGHKLQIFSDSIYCVNCLTVWHKKWGKHGWTTATGKQVSHRQLIEGTLHQLNRHRSAGSLVEIIHVRGHRGLTENERADRLARHARKTSSGNLKQSLLFPTLEPYQLSGKLVQA